VKARIIEGKVPLIRTLPYSNSSRLSSSELYRKLEGILFEDKDEIEKLRDYASLLDAYKNYLIESYPHSPRRTILGLTEIPKEFRVPCTEKLLLLQAVGAVRYDVEAYYEGYKGNFTLPNTVLSFLRQTLGRSRVIFEGACGTGENLKKLSEYVDGYFIGLELSEKMAENAGSMLSTANANGMIIQGSLTSIPLEDDSVDVSIVLNAWDRVYNPRKAAEELYRITRSDGIVVIGNCQPLQFESPGAEFTYVLPENRLELEEILSDKTEKLIEWEGKWGIETILDGYEVLDEKVIVKRVLKGGETYETTWNKRLEF